MGLWGYGFILNLNLRFKFCINTSCYYILKVISHINQCVMKMRTGRNMTSALVNEMYILVNAAFIQLQEWYKLKRKS